MKIFDESFKRNRSIALKNRDKELKLRLSNNTKSLRKVDYTNSTENIGTGTLDNEIYVYKDRNTEKNLLDADYISDNFERDSRRYPSNLDLETGGGF